jgi:DNA replication protein DnaC
VSSSVARTVQRRQPADPQVTLRRLPCSWLDPQGRQHRVHWPTGVGKTGLACGLLLKALQNGYRGLFIKAQDLFDEMYASIADRASRKLIRRWGPPRHLIDEVGYFNLRPEQTNIFFKLMEERYRREATLITCL